jgi:2-C-methyl-D-erythritol 4-phosphate cytidylyltransferase
LAGLNPATRYVLVHDIRRPLASSDLADRILDSLRRGSDVVVPALTMVDSVKAVDSAGAVTETVDRSLLRSAQFPRGFEREHLTTILGAIDAGDFDEFVLAQRAGIPATVIDGDPDAFALDIPRDVGLADAIYTCRLAEQR